MVISEDYLVVDTNDELYRNVLFKIEKLPEFGTIYTKGELNKILNSLEGTNKLYLCKWKKKSIVEF